MRQKKILRACFIVLCHLQYIVLQAQNENVPLLERNVSISAQNQTIESVLDQISAQSDVMFSFSPDIIPSGTKVSLTIEGKSVRFALNSLLDSSITYKVKGDYIILKRERSNKINQHNQIIEGYVYDSQSGKKMTDASIYNKDLTAAAVTDKYGYFRMRLPSGSTTSPIRLSKAGYTDTIFKAINHSSLRTLEISLQLDGKNKKTRSFLFQKMVPLWLVPKQTLTNSVNINKSIFKAVQFSLLPTISTNHFLRGNTINYVSINLLAGYLEGVRIVEFGGLINIVMEDLQYAEIGGIGNVVGNNVTGVQAAGVFNTSLNVHGIQTAGILNNSIAKADFQISGIYNHAQTGISQTAGIVNLSKDMKVQVACVVNSASNAQVQISGIVNSVTASKGVQLAGVINYARDSACIQVSGLLNRTGYNRSLQLSVVNIADSSNGIQVGLFNFVKHGYHKIAISTDEIFPINIYFSSGIRRFHTLLLFGANPFKNTATSYNFGYGLGTSFIITDKLLLDIDLANREVFSKDDPPFNNHLFQIYSGFDKSISSNMSIAAGLTYNYLLYNDAGATNTLSASLPPYEITSHSFSNGDVGKSWFGARVSIRFQ